jgi:hypothetical protein
MRKSQLFEEVKKHTQARLIEEEKKVCTGKPQINKRKSVDKG